MTETPLEPVTSPIFRLGVAVLFLCCAALAIRYAWFEYERSGAGMIPEEGNATLSPEASSQPTK